MTTRTLADYASSPQRERARKREMPVNAAPVSVTGGQVGKDDAPGPRRRMLAC
jgi:hypothetical protein